MDTYEVPFIKDLTLANIRNLLCTQYGYKKSELGSFIYQDSATFRKKANGSRPIQPEDLINLEYNITQKICNQNTAEYFKLMKKWFPELRYYDNESVVRNIISANLLGIHNRNAQTPTHYLTKEPISTVDFFQSCLENNSPISCICLVAQTGWSWFDDPEKRRLLKLLADKGIHIRVIGNPMTDEMRKYIIAMQNPEKELDYRGVNTTLDEWHKYETIYNNIQLKISIDYPIIRQSYIVEFKNGEVRCLERAYAYGSPIENWAPRKIIMGHSDEYTYYEKEFNFLWDNGINYDMWLKKLPKSDDCMLEGEYILIYPSHHKVIHSNQKWIYCLLTIGTDNKVYMKTNILNLNLESFDDYEYIYEGEIKTTSKTINIFLSDSEQEEMITITFPKPIRTIDRYIGIISALNPSGTAPVAFKCACIKQTLLQRVNYDLLYYLLSNNNKLYNNNLMVIEPQNTDIFYSKRMLND